MPNNSSPNYAPEIVGGLVVEVAGHVVGRNLIDGLRKSFTPTSLEEQGDYFMDQSRVLLQNHLRLMELAERNKIHQSYELLRKAKERLDSHNGSQFQKFFQARNYKRISKVTYKIVKHASDRAVDDLLMNQIVEATVPPGGGSGSGPGTGSVASNPFADSHAIRTLTDMSVNNLDQLEMSTYRADNTDGAAVVVDAVARDKSVQHLVSTFSTTAISGDTSDRGAPEAPAAVSLHQEDGTMPRLIATTQTDVSMDQMANEEAEAHSLDSSTSTVVYGTSEGTEPQP